MRKLLATLVGLILVITIGFVMYTRLVEAGQWVNANGGWAYSVRQTCRNGISFSLAFFDTRPITIERTLDAPVTRQRLTLSNQPINLDPDPADPPSDKLDYSGFFAVPWTEVLEPATPVTLTFETVQGTDPFTWTTEQPQLVADCFLPDLSIDVSDSPDPVARPVCQRARYICCPYRPCRLY